MDWHITKDAITDYLDAQSTIAPEGSPTWKTAERELADLLPAVAAKKQPKQDGAQRVYKCGRDLLRETLGNDHLLAQWDGGSLELYLHVALGGQLVAVRRRGTTRRKQG